jgi:proteasome assembly chaperone (PAC2) family protein
MNGLLVGLAKLRGMHGISLLGETSGYIIDANASKAVLTVFAKMLNLKIDMTRLTERATSTASIVNTPDQLSKGHSTASASGPKKDKNLGYIS